MAVAAPVRAEQHHAISVAPVRIGEVPLPLVIEAHDRLDPAGAIEVGPLVAHAQMHFDDAAADALDVNDAGIASQMAADPCAAIVLDAGFPSGMHRPIVECAFPARLSGDVAPPARLALYDRDIRTDVAALQERHPHVSRREACFVLRLGGENAARYAHTFEI